VAEDNNGELEQGTEAESTDDAAEVAEPTAEETPAEAPAAAEEPAAPAASGARKASAKAAKAEPKAEPRKRTPRPKVAKKEPVKKERGTYMRQPKPEREQGRRKERRGVVMSDKGDKTITVRIDSAKPHPKYLKIVRRSTKIHAHDEKNQAKIGDLVRVVECRPLSRTKRWRLVEILEAAK
jgi:small subunit ribosomal protein S17